MQLSLIFTIRIKDIMTDWFELKTGGVTLNVRVQPRAARNAIVGVMQNGALKVRLQAPPVDGRANAQLVKFLANQWNISRADIRILSGGSGRNKRLHIASGTAELLKELLSIKPC
jgi:uncharacterized protein (TIGR00251 family)